MIDQLLQIAQAASLETRRNLAREYLQCYLLRLLQDRADQRGLAFCGGTALRLLHGLQRFSEDLDFTAIQRTQPDAIRPYFESIATGCRQAGYRLRVKLRTDRTVANAMFRFEGLPAALDLTGDARLALSIRLEVDSAPPAGAGVETTLIQRFFPIALVHHDLPSLFAGKLHALLARPWSKGRDWYDLVWYAGRHPQVRLSHLEARLRQSGDYGDAALLRLDRLKEWLRQAVEGLDIEQARTEAGRFVRDRRSLDIWSQEFFYQVVERIQSAE